MLYEVGLKTKRLQSYDPAGYRTMTYSHWGEGADKVMGCPPILCVHGLVRNRHDFDPLARVLRRFTSVYCPDMPGHGDSAHLDDGARYNFKTYQNDLMMMIARMGADQVDFIGSSMGGLLGISLAALPGSPIRRLVLNDVGPFVSADFSRTVKAYIESQPVFDDLAGATAHMKEAHKGRGEMDEDEWTQLAQDSIKERGDGKWVVKFDPKLAIGLVDTGRDIDLWDSFKKIKADIFVVHGARSMILTPDLIKEMQRLQPGMRVETVERAGHAPSLSHENQITAVQSFLDLERPVSSLSLKNLITEDEKLWFTSAQTSDLN